MYIYTTTEKLNLTDNFSEPILPENPIRYSRTTRTNPHVLLAPVYFFLVLLVLYLLDNLQRVIVKCLKRRMLKKNSKQKKEQKTNYQRSKFVVDMECNECKECAGKLLCRHHLTRVL